MSASEVLLPSELLPESVQTSIASIVAHNSAQNQDAVKAWVPEPYFESKHAIGLVQLDNGKRIPPTGWSCEYGDGDCDKKENLWLNLSDGMILCGRKNFDGSGGNHHAVMHFETTKYPLAVKLGTITADGKADVYSYDEDDMVLDPLLRHHLAHFGIDIDAMKKTEQTIAEMEVDHNLSFDFSRISEGDKELVPLFGPGYTGLKNIGNTCYLASVIQVLVSIPEFREHFASPDTRPIPSNFDPSQDLCTQSKKLLKWMADGRYSVPEITPETIEGSVEADDGQRKGQSQAGIPPRMFKAVIGRDHPEFKTARQQDALEFFQYLMEEWKRMNTTIKNGSAGDDGQRPSPTEMFRFFLQDRLECSSSKKVRYTERSENVLSLPVPLEAATNIDEVAQYRAAEKAWKDAGSIEADKPTETIRPRIPFSACLDAFGGTETIPDFFSSAIGAKTVANKTVAFTTFPDYLVVHMRRFYIGDNWAPAKLDVFIDVPDEINIEHLRRKPGIQDGEGALPEAPPAAAAIVEADPTIVVALASMGFPQNRCEKAAIKVNNSDTNAAMEWLFAHMEDADIDEPIRPASGPVATAPVDETGLAMLLGMGFDRAKCEKALRSTNNNVERATDWIFSHMDDDGSEDVEMSSTSGDKAEQQKECTDGEGKYELAAFISHSGSSAHCGHYVCHIKKEGRWVLFNDRKVAVSEEPPRQLGYIYFFKRKQ
eukprot:TRINITY_DN3943_c0_g1_i3.p1 TRINITY_DN3943_c0_g1~~TRINITY_DN3943_c0_g1_i3.p1  ORF type:complete len:712 (-),score=177.96 TRINITY_DN3943_c0_g1_i3:44-2179(-)